MARPGAVPRTIDISMPLFPGMPAFPGDPPFSVAPAAAPRTDAPYALSVLGLGSHTGTHVDPPSHFFPEGPSVDALDPDLLNGPAAVVRVPPDRTSIGPAELGALPLGAQRVLLRTANSERWAAGLGFFPDYVGLSVAGAQFLFERGVRCVGIDALSIENDPTEQYPVHRALLRRGIPIVEGLLLGAAPPGPYLLECLPLRIRGGDGAPARAVLFRF